MILIFGAAATAALPPCPGMSTNVCRERNSKEYKKPLLEEGYWSARGKQAHQNSLFHCAAPKSNRAQYIKERSPVVSATGKHSVVQQLASFARDIGTASNLFGYAVR